MWKLFVVWLSTFLKYDNEPFSWFLIIVISLEHILDSDYDHLWLKYTLYVRFGNVFKSHILGCPTIVSMDPELNKYILMNEAKGLVPGYPQSMLDILGKCNIAAVHGSTHKNMRGALLALVSPPMIRDTLLPKIDDFMRSHLSSWNGRIIDIQEKTKEVCSCHKLNYSLRFLLLFLFDMSGLFVTWNKLLIYI